MSTNPPRRAELKSPPLGLRTRWDMGSVSPADAARFSGISETRIWELMKANKITWGYLPNTKARSIPVASLVAYLDANVEVTEGEW